MHKFPSRGDYYPLMFDDTKSPACDKATARGVVYDN